MTNKIHPTVMIEEDASIGQEVVLWDNVHVRTRAKIGDRVTVGRGAFIDHHVVVGAKCKIQNYALLYSGSVLEDGVFIGPRAVLLNDRRPRAINPDGSKKGVSDWKAEGVLLRYGAAIGGGAIINPGVIVGRWAMIGAGALVVRNVPDYGLYAGTPARLMGYVSPTGNRLHVAHRERGIMTLRGDDGFELELPDDGVDY